MNDSGSSNDNNDDSLEIDAPGRDMAIQRAMMFLIYARLMSVLALWQGQHVTDRH